MCMPVSVCVHVCVCVGREFVIQVLQNVLVAQLAVDSIPRACSIVDSNCKKPIIYVNSLLKHYACEKHLHP